MSKRPQGLGSNQTNKRKILRGAIVLLIIASVGLFAAKLWRDSQCTSWLISAEGTKVACIGTVGDDAKAAAKSARINPK